MTQLKESDVGVLVSSGFNQVTAERILRNNITVDMARMIGPDRMGHYDSERHKALTQGSWEQNGLLKALEVERELGSERLSLEDLITAGGAPLFHSSKDIGDLISTARASKFSITALFLIASGASRPTLNDFWGYLAAGINAAPEIRQAQDNGPRHGAWLPGYMKLNINIETMALLDNRDTSISPETVKEFFEIGVRDYGRMIKLHRSIRRLGGVTLKEWAEKYTGVGVTSLDDMERLLSAPKPVYPDAVAGFRKGGVNSLDEMIGITQQEVEGGTFADYTAAGVKTATEMRALKTVDVDRTGVECYRRAGVETTRGMIVLAAHGIKDRFGDETLLNQLVEAGFKGNVPGMVRLSERKADLIRHYDFQGRSVAPFLHPYILSLAKIGFAGDADSLLEMWDSGVPTQFAKAHLALLDGNRPTTPSELAKSIIAAYQVKEVAPTAASA